MSPAASRLALTDPPPVESGHRTRRDRRRRRLYLFQCAERPRSLRRARLHLQFQEYRDAISKRRRYALRLGCIAVPVEAVMVGLVGYVYKGLGCDSGSGDRVAASSPVGSRRSPDRIPVSGRRHAGLYLTSRLTGEFAAENRPSRLECLGHLRHLAAGARRASDNKTIVREYSGSTKLRLVSGLERRSCAAVQCLQLCHKADLALAHRDGR